jgi:crotonobetainyl-CoA:carnitine CoA-transferase CaiB-like acyl-CoA transferase
MSADSQPLAGLKVLDLAWVVAGPLIGRSLADYGATVVRIDSSKRVETARLMGPFPNGKFDVQQSTLYENCNAGKFGLSLDLRVEAARDVVRDLAAWADIAVESFTPGQMDKWGLGYERLAAINPGLIMVSTSLMGQSGPWTRYSGYGNHGAAISGFQNIVGPEGGPPVGPFGPYTDFVAPRFGLVAALAALDQRRRTGRGCHLDVSQSEAGMQFLAPQIADYSVTGRIQGCAGARDVAMAPHGVFAAAGWDSWVAIAVRDDAEWAALARLIGGEALAADARFATLGPARPTRPRSRRWSRPGRPSARPATSGPAAGDRRAGPRRGRQRRLHGRSAAERARPFRAPGPSADGRGGGRGIALPAQRHPRAISEVGAGLRPRQRPGADGIPRLRRRADRGAARCGGAELGHPVAA